MVTGTYDAALGTDHSEFPDYTRADFTATTDNPNSFLVRMRRTHNPDDLDEVADVSSRGGGLPLMLGRAGWMAAEPSEAPYSIRRDGVNVHANAIANAVPARSVGVADLSLSPPLIGLAPIAIELTEWQAMIVSTTYTLNVSDGQLTDPDNNLIATAKRVSANAPAFVAQVLADIELAWPEPELIADETETEFYIPIVSDVSSTTDPVTQTLIVGFARIRATRSGTTFTISPQNQNVAAENASALPAHGWQTAMRSGLQMNAAFSALSTVQQTTVVGEMISAAYSQSRNLVSDNGLLSPTRTRTLR